MKIFNLLNAVGFIFLLGSSVMAAEEAPRVNPSVPPKNTYHRLATKLVDFWCSPLGHKMLDLFKDVRNQDRVIDSLGHCEARCWRTMVMEPDVIYFTHLIQRLLVIEGSSILGSRKYHSYMRTITGLTKYLDTNWTDIGFLNETLRCESKKRELRQQKAEEMVTHAMQILNNSNPAEWMENSITRKELGIMLRWVFLSSFGKPTVRILEDYLPEQDVEQIKAEVRAKGGIIY